MAAIWSLRSAMLAGVCAAIMAGASSPARAGPAEDAAFIQSLLDKGKPADAEPVARAALARGEAEKGERSAEAANLHRLLGDTLFDQKKFADAEPHFRKALAIRAKILGPDHLDTARSAGDLAANLKASGKPADAEPFYRQALGIRTKALGANHQESVRSLWRLALAVDAQGRLADAAGKMREVAQRAQAAFGADSLPLAAALADLGSMQADLKDAGAQESYSRALAIREKALPPGDEKIAESMRSLARLLIRTGKPEAAISLLDGALSRDEKALGAFAPKIGDLAEFFATQMMLAQRPEKAEPLFAKLVTIRTAGSGAESPEAADAMESHALALQALERLDEAEALRRSAMAIRLKSGGQGSEGAITSTLHLANLVEKRDRPVEAEALYKKALDAGLSALGPDHQLVAFSQLFLGMLLFGQNRLAEAEPLLKRGVAVMEKSGKTGGMADSARSTLALLMAGEKRFDEAASLFETLLARTEKAEGAGSLTAARYRLSLATMLERQGKLDEAGEHVALAIPVLEAAESEKPALASALATLGHVRHGQGKFAEADAIFASVAARLTALYGENDRSVLSSIGNQALAKAAMGQDAAAAALFERYVAGMDRLAAANAAALRETRAGKVEDSAISAAAAYGSLIRLYARLGGREPEKRAAYSEKAFLVAQRIVESQAASALSQMTARQASGSGELASLLRSREDAVEAWQRADRQLTALRAGAALDPARERRLAAELVDKDAAIRAADAKIAADFAGFGALSQPALPGFAAVQAALADNELALFYTDAGDLGGGRSATYLWAVPKSGEPVWVELERGSGEIAAAVRHMRGLLGVGVQTRGAKTLGAGVKTDVQADVLKAGEEIFKALIGPVAEMTKGKALVIVPTKRLAALPFQLLVSKAASEGSADKYRDAGWLVKDHALTVMPSLAALMALKAPGLAAARTPYLAFANPLLTGRGGADRRAFTRAGCAGKPVAPAALPALPQAADLFGSAGADPAAVRALAPLPETVDEVCAVAAALGAGNEALRLGAAANENEIKALSANGALEQVAIVHFATHGLISGDLTGLAEPAIVLTPPETASSANDGLLTASEVAALKFNADWVILSACNTASGEGGGEALSGLARAFFYAGARSLLVSHWPVNSDAAVSLVTKAVSEIAGGQDRAEALRRAMLAEIAKGGAHAEPENWAPFVLVGG